MRKAAALIAAMLGAVVLAPQPASAGSFTVRVCEDGGGSYVNNVFSGSAQGARAHVDALCRAGRGLYTDIAPMGNWAYYPEGGALAMCAPGGTRITGYRITAETHWQGAGYDRRIDGGPCGNYTALSGGPLPASFDSRDAPAFTRSGIAVGGLRLITFCAKGPCSGNFAKAEWDRMTLTLDDYTPPAIAGGRGLWGQGGWVRGTWDVAFDSADSTGIRSMTAQVDRGSAWEATMSGSCQPDGDVTRVNPCSATTATLSQSFDTTTVADGGHDLTLQSQDGGRNTATSRLGYFDVDNTPPVASLDRPAASFGRAVAWNVADARSGVNAGSLAASYSADGGASWHAMSGSWDAGTGRYTATIPATVPDGTLPVRLTGRDNAQPGGNSFATPAAPVTVYTAAPPRPAALRVTPSEWSAASSFDVAWRNPTAGPPIARAHWTLCRDGGDCSSGEASGEAIGDLRVPSPGSWEVAVRLEDSQGQLGPAAVTSVRHDPERPVVIVRGAGRPDTPHPGSVTVALRASDALSGMGGDAFVAYRVDHGDWTRARGDRATVLVDRAGTHTLSYYAADAAGNESEVESRTIVIGAAGDSARPLPPGFHARAHNPETTFRAATRFSDPCPARATLRADRDATVDEGAPDARGGGAGELEVAGGAPRRDALVGFPLPAAPSCAVESAVLRLYGTSAGGDGAVEVTRASSAWTEPAVNWNTRPGSVGPAATAEAADGWTEWDVTAQVQALYESGDNGLYLRAGDQAIGFCAREGALPRCGAELRPQLDLRFSG